MWLQIKTGKLTRATDGSAGYDLYCDEDRVLIPPGERRLIKTGLVTEFLPGSVGLIRDKSGLALKFGITVLGGVIDADYPGEWGVILLNTGREAVIFNRGDKIAQVVFMRHETLQATVLDGAVLEEAKVLRTGGFGSTG